MCSNKFLTLRLTSNPAVIVLPKLGDVVRSLNLKYYEFENYVGTGNVFKVHMTDSYDNEAYSNLQPSGLWLPTTCRTELMPRNLITFGDTARTQLVLTIQDTTGSNASFDTLTLFIDMVVGVYG